MPQHQRWSVQGLLYGLTAAAVIPAAVLLAISGAKQYQADEDAAALSAYSLAQLVADNVQATLSDAQHSLARIADRPAVRSMAAGQCDPIFQQFPDLFPQFSNLSQANLEGYIVCSARAQPANGMTYVGNAAWYSQVHAKQTFIVAPPYLGPVTRRIVSVLAQPVRDGSGRIVGSVQMPLDLAKLRVVRGAEKLPDSTLVAVVDSAGVLVARSRNAEHTVGRNMREVAAVKIVLAKKNGTGRAVSSEGIERVLGFVPIPGTDWYAVAGIDVRAVLASARTAALLNGVFGALFLLLIVVLTVYLGRRIARPMAAVQDAARRAASGDLGVRVPYDGPLEVADFALQFNTMLDAIRSSQRELASAQAELVLLGTGLSHLTDMVLIMDARQSLPGGWPRIVFANQAFEEVSGYGRASVQGQPMSLLHGPQTDIKAVDALLAAIAANRPCRQELVLYTGMGAAYWVEIDLLPVRAAGTAIAGHWIAIYRDITARKRAERSIHKLAYVDTLTDLPNRATLVDQLGQALQAAGASGVLGAVLFIDLDHFKNINDARGHAVGDALLQLAARRLATAIRPGDTLARLGGDEFIVVMAALARDPCQCARAGMALAAAVCAAMARPFDIAGQPYSATASIGVALLRGGAQTPNDVLREADTAMYSAKQRGRNGAALFAPDMQAAVETRLALEHDLGHALQRGELAVHVQTQVDAAGQAAGAELLLRWQHPLRGSVSPAVFIPIAEESGLIVEIGAWVIEQACQMLARMQQAEAAAGPGTGLVPARPLPLSVNVSTRQFRDADFVDQVGAIIARSGAPGARLIFEVTESLLIDNLDEVIARMGELGELGIRFSIDDFGTGYSSMAYLKRLPLHELKIDRSFISDLPHDGNDNAIVRMILSMARHLGLQAVAEGVETAEQAGFLAASGCQLMQGYLYARPIAQQAWLAQRLQDQSALPSIMV